ncbi:MAG: NAD-dependent epimerase/dehydratase family protein [Candidatus Latescibacterota bacterium]|jgi:UDP-glucose 4-epimerase
MAGKALVTGVAGFIGSHLAEELLSTGADVVGIDSLTDYYDIRLKQQNLDHLTARSHFTFVPESLNETDLHALLDGVDFVFHQAAQAGVRASWGTQFEDYIDCNVRATQKLCEAAKNKRLKKFVYASSSSVYGDTDALPMTEDAVARPVSPYGVTKLDAENMCLLYKKSDGLPAVCLRYFTVYGPRQRPDMAFHKFLKSAMTGAPVEVYGNGEQTRDFTFISDIVAANILAMRYTGNEAIFNIGGGSRVSINHVLDIIGRYARGDFDVRYKDSEKGDVKHTYADTSRARKELSYDPQTRLEDGIQREAEWIKTILEMNE